MRRCRTRALNFQRVSSKPAWAFWLLALGAPSRTWGSVFPSYGSLSAADPSSWWVGSVLSGRPGAYSSVGVDGSGTSVVFNGPQGLASAPPYLYVADTSNHCIRRVTIATAFTAAVAGVCQNGYGTNPPPGSGYADGTGTAAMFYSPAGLAFYSGASSGVFATNTLFIADRNNHRVRAMSTTFDVTTLAGSGAAGWADAVAGGAVSNARFNAPSAVAVGSVAVGLVSYTVAGDIFTASVGTLPAGTQLTFAPGTSTLAFGGCVGFTSVSSGTAYACAPGLNTFRISDSSSCSPLCTVTSGAPGTSTVTPAAAVFAFVSDTGNGMIRRVDAAGAVTTLSGCVLSGSTCTGTRVGGSPGYPYLYGGPGATAFAGPYGLALTTSGYLFVADRFFVRRVHASTGDSINVAGFSDAYSYTMANGDGTTNGVSGGGGQLGFATGIANVPIAFPLELFAFQFELLGQLSLLHLELDGALEQLLLLGRIVDPLGLQLVDRFFVLAFGLGTRVFSLREFLVVFFDSETSFLGFFASRFVRLGFD